MKYKGFLEEYQGVSVQVLDSYDCTQTGTKVPFNPTGGALSVDLLAHEGQLVLDISYHANRYSDRERTENRHAA